MTQDWSSLGIELQLKDAMANLTAAKVRTAAEKKKADAASATLRAVCVASLDSLMEIWSPEFDPPPGFEEKVEAFLQTYDTSMALCDQSQLPIAQQLVNWREKNDASRKNLGMRLGRATVPDKTREGPRLSQMKKYGRQ